jgi:5-hydroxyisourate hydrolase
MTHVTTHILDAVRGAPATNVAVTLAQHLPGGGTQPIADGFTDADGRLALGADRLEPGLYAISFASGTYFADQGVETFYPLVTVTFTIADERHYHVPLLLSPFAYSTYRGT